jgi:hypothetical protein
VEEVSLIGVPASDADDDVVADVSEETNAERLGTAATSAGVGGAAAGLRRASSWRPSVCPRRTGGGTSARTSATHLEASAGVSATRNTARDASLSGSACFVSRSTHRPAYDLLPWKFTEDTDAPLRSSRGTCDSALASPGETRNVRRAPVASRDTQRLFHRFKCSDRFNIHFPASRGPGASE